MKRIQEDGERGAAGVGLVGLWGRAIREGLSEHRPEGGRKRAAGTSGEDEEEHNGLRSGAQGRGERAGEEGKSGVVSQGWGCGFLSKCDRACGVLRTEAPGLIYVLQGSLRRWDRTSGTAFHGPALTHRLRGRPVPLKDAQILGWRCHVGSTVVWELNGQPSSSGSQGKFCSGHSSTSLSIPETSFLKWLLNHFYV